MNVTVRQLAETGHEIYVYRAETDDLIGDRPPERFVLAGYVSGVSNDSLMGVQVRGVLKSLGNPPNHIMVWV